MSRMEIAKMKKRIMKTGVVKIMGDYETVEKILKVLGEYFDGYATGILQSEKGCHAYYNLLEVKE